MSDKQMGPRSEMGRLDAAMLSMVLSEVKALQHDVKGSPDNYGGFWRDKAKRQRKAIIERVRKMIRRAKGARP